MDDAIKSEKHILFDEFFALTPSSSMDELDAIEKKIQDYASRNAKDRQVEDVLRLAQIYRITGIPLDSF